MLDIFLCHAPADREIAQTIAARLRFGAEAQVWLDECTNTLPSAWEAGGASAAIVLLLSPDAVPPRFKRDDWQSLLSHFETSAEPPVASILVQECPYPKLIERKNFFRWHDNPIRAIERWAVALHDTPPGAFVPAPLPWFEGRTQELDFLWRALVDQAGSLALVNPEPSTGKSALAQTFARAAAGHFREVLWIACGDRPSTSILGELGSRLEVAPERAPHVLQEHRLLLV